MPEGVLIQSIDLIHIIFDIISTQPNTFQRYSTFAPNTSVFDKIFRFEGWSNKIIKNNSFSSMATHRCM